MPAPFTSINSHLRGFNYQRDYNSVADWAEEMQREESGDRELNWSCLFRVSDGEAIRSYRRGCLPPFVRE